MHKLIEYCCDELDELESKVKKGGKLSPAETEYGNMLAQFKKNLLKGEEMSEGEYSGRMYGRSYDDGRSYGYDDSRSYGRSYARRRDSMGRYSRYSGDEMADELRELMEKAPDEQTKREFKKFIEKIEMM